MECPCSLAILSIRYSGLGAKRAHCSESSSFNISFVHGISLCDSQSCNLFTEWLFFGNASSVKTL